MSDIGSLKKVVAIFLKTDPASINESTIIDRMAIKGSIMVHRMYAAIAKETGSEVKSYHNIRTFGELMATCGLAAGTPSVSVSEKKVTAQPKIARSPGFPMSAGRLSVGIDMEEVARMPRVKDFRSDPFYLQNFCTEEIEYCASQPEPLQSFTGKFAAKEAVVKADGSFRSVPFNEISINNDSSGRPFFREFAISISHTDQFVVAVAIKI